MGLFGLSLPKKVDNILGAVGAQINPFDNGQTYNTVRQGVQPAAPVAHPNILTNIDRGVTGAISGLKQGGEGVIKSDIISPAVQTLAQWSGNPYTVAAANQYANQSAAQAAPLVQGIARTVPEALATLTGKQTTYHPQTPIEQAIFGKTPVQNIEKNVANNYNTHANLPAWERLPLAASDLAGQVLNTAPVAGAAIKGVKAADAAATTRGVNLGVGNLGMSTKDITPEAPAVPPTPKEVAMGKALGMSKKDVAAVKAAGSTDTAKLAELGGGSPEGLPKTTLGPAAVNTARNPFKAVTQQIKQGDYGAVISNEQAIAKPIDFVGGQWAHAMKGLNDSDRANFWKAVEDPSNPAHSPKLQAAINLWREADNRVHANSQALGGNTNYLTDHALHPWQLPEEYTQHIVNGGNPDKFKGLNAISRKYRTVTEGEAAGLKLGEDPVGEGSRYLAASSALLRRASLKQDIAQADSAIGQKTHTLDLGNGHSVPVSSAGMKALKGVQAMAPSENAAIKGLRTANVGLKSTLLSAGQFHPINIGVLRAAPTLALTGHPIAAAKVLGGTFRPLLPGGDAWVAAKKAEAIKSGRVDAAAKIGMPYGGGGYDTSGSALKGGVGHNMVFNKQMFTAHDEVVKAILSDLKKKDVSLDSEAARRAGASGNRLMGFINKEAAGISPRTQRIMGDWLLAGQFTPSKIGQVRAVFRPGSYKDGGVAAKYAAASVAANVAATSVILTGVGYLAKQKSDDMRDLLLRALINPAVPTNMKDSKGDYAKDANGNYVKDSKSNYVRTNTGNTLDLRTPGTDTSDIAKLLGIKLVRQNDGHLGVSWNPNNLPSTVEDFARARLGPLASSIVKVGTNSTFSSQPLYDPNAPAGKKAIQAGTSLAVGELPIGTQGLAYTKAVKGILPGSAKEVLDASTPGSNPVAKSIGSAFGLSPATDTTVGKGLQTTQYFDQLAKAKKGLTASDQDVFDSIFNTKKNPVTGKYDNPANVWDSGARATQLLDHPQVLNAAVKMNQALKAAGQTIDPLYDSNLTSKQRQTYLSYEAQTEPATRAEMRTENPYIQNLSDARSKFFDNLPLGDPNKPQNPIPYPNPSKAVANLQNQYFNTSDATQRLQLITNNPELADQFAAEDQYNRSVRDAKELPQYDSYPTASKTVQSNLDTYEALPKGATRTAWIDGHPTQWSQITSYLTQTSLYNLEQSAQSAAFQKQGFDQKGLKAISNLGQDDIGNYTDANGNKIYAIAPGSNFGGSSVGGYYSANNTPSINVASFMKKIPVAGGPRVPGGGAKVPRPKVKKVSGKIAIKGKKAAKPKVTMVKMA